jgi:hypothetical protein
MSRRVTAIELADVLEKQGFTAAQASSAEPYVWAMAAELAGHADTPDESTRERAVRVLRDREANPDPFAAFQGADL